MRPEKLVEELRGGLKGDITVDPIAREIFSTGACLYRVKPKAVVWPKEVEDVAKVLEVAVRAGIPVTARGGGTSRTGNELGEGIVLDFSRYMNRILEFDPDQKLVTVEPGVVLNDLNDFLKPHGLFFAPDPSTKEHCTIGGMIANNSSGPMSVKYGTTRKHVYSLEILLPDGRLLRTGPRSPEQISAMEPREREIYQGLMRVIEEHGEALRDERPLATKDSSGYHLWDVRGPDGSLDLTPMMVGSEGTLAVVTEATLRLMPVLPARLSAIIHFRDISTVGEATQRILAFGPSMVEIMERQILELARKANPALADHIPAGTEALLVVELEGHDTDSLRSALTSMGEQLVGENGLADRFMVARDAQEMALFSRMRSISGPILNRVRGARKPRAFIEDPAVHPSRLTRYIEGLRNLFSRHAVEASIYGHAGDGNLHSMVFLDLSDPHDVRRMTELSSDVYDLVLELKGTISGEHGDGRLRTQFLPRQYPRLHRAFGLIKALFDPAHILNPGIIVGDKEPALSRMLRFRSMDSESTSGPLGHPSLIEEIQSCSGCGKCRWYCPVARGTLSELASGRAKISLVREILAGNLPDSVLAFPAFREVMELCINCKRCLRECPSGVDVPWVALLGRKEALRTKGEELRSRLLTDTRLLCRVGSATAPLSNLALGSRPMRIVLEKAMGLNRNPKLPPFSRATAKSLIGGIKGDAPKKRRVALFLSCHANFNDPRGEALAAVKVLEANDLQVVFPEVRCCSIARISSGARKGVLGDPLHNVKELARVVREGLPILFTEPSCLLAVKMEYPRLLQNDESREVANACVDIHDYLLGLHSEGLLRFPLGRIQATVGHHAPCHLRSIGEAHGPARLLETIPGMTLVRYSDCCCGMGGTFGLKASNADLSKKMGAKLAREIGSSGVELVATSCAACRIRIQEATGLRVVHPLEILAKAYR